MESKKMVIDYTGNLIAKAKARKILDKYYEEGVSCFFIKGKWYKISSPLIVYDHYKKDYILKGDRSMLSGVVNKKGDIGQFSENDYNINIREKAGAASRHCLNEEIAISLGYVENLGDGIFYNKENMKDQLSNFNKKTIPSSERSSKYNLESDKEAKARLIEMYNSMDIKISPRAKRIDSCLGNFTFGCEWEVINGFLPKRIRNRLALKVLKDGSLRSDEGEGLEIVSMPMKGAKGVQIIIDTCKELTKRCEANSLCSFHIHYGNVRRDKLYILSLFRLMSKIQQELAGYFPYSRFHSIRPDGKTYCNFLPDLDVKYSSILSSKDEEEFKKRVVLEFGKVYMWMNDGSPLSSEYAPPKVERKIKIINGRKMFKDEWLKSIYTTKSIVHSSHGAHKWDMKSRYFIVNVLNLFFNNIGTIEFRPAESSMNDTKNLVWLVVYSSILRYAENIKECMSDKPITLSDVLKPFIPAKNRNAIINYLQYRKKFFDPGKNWKTTEKEWHKMDLIFNEQYVDSIL